MHVVGVRFRTKGIVFFFGGSQSSDCSPALILFMTMWVVCRPFVKDGGGKDLCHEAVHRPFPSKSGHTHPVCTEVGAKSNSAGSRFVVRPFVLPYFGVIKLLVRRPMQTGLVFNAVWTGYCLQHGNRPFCVGIHLASAWLSKMLRRSWPNLPCQCTHLTNLWQCLRA